MNFEYKKESKNVNDKTIRRYDKENGKLVITFLDNTTVELPLSKENENKILNKMINQAEDREAFHDSDDLEHRIQALSGASGLLASTILFGYLVQSDTLMQKLIATGVIGGELVLNSVCIHISKEELDELKKYSIYLANREKLDEFKENPSLRNGVKSSEKELNINTLDNYSLKDLKRMRKNLRAIQQIRENPKRRTK